MAAGTSTAGASGETAALIGTVGDLVVDSDFLPPEELGNLVYLTSKSARRHFEQALGGAFVEMVENPFYRCLLQQKCGWDAARLNELGSFAGYKVLFQNLRQSLLCAKEPAEPSKRFETNDLLFFLKLVDDNTQEVLYSQQIDASEFLTTAVGDPNEIDNRHPVEIDLSSLQNSLRFVRDASKPRFEDITVKAILQCTRLDTWQSCVLMDSCFYLGVLDDESEIWVCRGSHIYPQTWIRGGQDGFWHIVLNMEVDRATDNCNQITIEMMEYPPRSRTRNALHVLYNCPNIWQL